MAEGGSGAIDRFRRDRCYAADPGADPAPALADPEQGGGLGLSSERKTGCEADERGVARLCKRDVERDGAEDFVLGRLVSRKLGKRVVLARSVVSCVSWRRSVSAFVKRYARWSVMQRQCAGLPAYWGLLLLNPMLLATLAVLLSPSLPTVVAWSGCALARGALDAAAARVLRGRSFSPRALAWTPLKDLLIAGAWLYGLTNRTIEWRSTRLVVLRGSALRPELPRLRLRPRRAPAGSGRAPASATA